MPLAVRIRPPALLAAAEAAVAMEGAAAREGAAAPMAVAEAPAV